MHGIDDNPAATKCLDCNFYLCEECTADHKKRRVSRHHKIATLAELKEGGTKQLPQKRYCADHEGEELKLYCRTCQEVICRDCTIVTHKQHDYTFIKDVREELTKKMEKLIASVDGKETEYKSLLDSIHPASEKEKQKLINEEAKVKAFFDKHIDKLQLRIEGLQNRKASVLSSLGAYSSMHTKQLLADEESLQFSQTRLTNARSFAQQQLSSASNADLAMMSKQVIQQLETIRKHKFKIVTAPLWEVSLSEDNPLESKIRSLSADDIANAINVPDLSNTALLGKNTFQINIKRLDVFQFMQPVVTVNLPFCDPCLVRQVTRLPGYNSWSVTYFIISYPQPRNGVYDDVDQDLIDQSSTIDHQFGCLQQASKSCEAYSTGCMEPSVGHADVNFSDVRYLQPSIASTSSGFQPSRHTTEFHRSKTYTLLSAYNSSQAAAVPTVKVTVEVNGIQARNSPFKLQLKKKIAIGTKVEDHRQRQGTIVERQSADYDNYCDYSYPGERRYRQHSSLPSLRNGYAFVQWYGDNDIRQIDIDRLKVLSSV